MRKSNLAQVGQGDPRVVAHPSFREIPKCLYPLASKKAKDEYDTLARMLFEAGQLTAGKHRNLSSYCMQFDVIQRSTAEGKTLRASTFTQLDKALKALKLDEIDKPVAASHSAPTNTFARCGFSARSR